MYGEDYSDEIEILRENGGLPDGFTERKPSITLSDSEYIAEEIGKLLTDGDGPLFQTSELYADTNENKNTEVSNINSLRLSQVPELLEDGLPINWTRGLNNDSTVFTLIELSRGDSEFYDIEADLVAAGINVHKVERLQSLRLLERFKNEIKDVTGHRPNGFKANISYLYHGTKVEKERLCEEGLDQRLSRMGHFGKGIYFSNNPSKCVQYCQPDTDGLACLLLCRVLLGEIKIYPKGEYDTTLRREPEKESSTHGWRYYDSVMGCPIDHNEYVVYENRRAMIEYIITFSLDNKTKISKSDSSLPQTARRPSISSKETNPLVQVDNHFQKIAVEQETAYENRQKELEIQYQPPSQIARDEDFAQTLQALTFAESSETLPEEQIARDEDFAQTLQALTFAESSETLPEEQIANDEDFAQTLQALTFAESNDTLPEDQLENDQAIAESLQTLSVVEAKTTLKSEMKCPPVFESLSMQATACGICIPVDDTAVGSAPEDLVLNLSVSEFLQITGVEDFSVARHYLEMANLDLSKAVSHYYENM